MVYYKNLNPDSVQTLLNHYGIQLCLINPDEDIPHSFWGAPEAGRMNDCLYIRGDTPIHSILHEACHYICMPTAQRALTLVDAKGSTREENATCFLQIVISDHLEGYGREILMQDMDDWGYSFRLGSAKAWFSQDAEDAQQWLMQENIINSDAHPTWNLRN